MHESLAIFVLGKLSKYKMSMNSCYHCGDKCKSEAIAIDQKLFCCNGCKTVYELLSDNDMTCYYDFQSNPGAIPTEIEGKYDYLENEDIEQKLLEFQEEDLHIVNFYIPHMHCSSCIWVLENLNRLANGVLGSQVDFPKKEVRISYKASSINLKQVVVLLNSIGYEPYISLDDVEAKTKKVDRSLIYKVGIAGFAFGNVMFLSFPEYFEVSEFWLEKYKYVFRYLMLFFSLPVVLYSASGFFVSAFKGLKNKILNIDVPIALGISVLFVRSTVEVVFDLGTGFFDSLTGLVFFLLLGKFFQQKTYNFLSFERDYKSYFPIAITRVTNQQEETIEIYDIQQGDRLLIRNQELIPVDGILISTAATIDYSFVTGESKPVVKNSGDKLYAGGKQVQGAIEMEAIANVSQSYLTQLWSNDVFQKDKTSTFQTITDGISRHFTVAVLLIALVAGLFWLYVQPSMALNVVTAVLIIACPCAIALAAPFTLGNMLRIFGNHKMYLKNTKVIEKLAGITTTIFDKTGTLTTNKQSEVIYEGAPLSNKAMSQLKSVFRTSNHPLSRKIYQEFDQVDVLPVTQFEEYVGKGVTAVVDASRVKVGSQSFVNQASNSLNFDTAVHVSLDGIYLGRYTLKNQYRTGVSKVFGKLQHLYRTIILSGDNEGERQFLEEILPAETRMHFNQRPQDKLDFVAGLQGEGQQVLMVGDGLNDSGAFAQSDVGMAISEDINVFSPACDAIVDASVFEKIPLLLALSKKSMNVIKYAFVLSFFYNIIGLYFAVTGQLAPVVAAILMPLSSISIVAFTTLATNLLSKKYLS